MKLNIVSTAGRLNRVENPYGETTTLSHDAAGRRTINRLANGTRTSTIYDAAGRTRAIWQRDHAGTAFASFIYAYDPAGNRTSVVELADDRVTWTYDQTNQLLGEDRSGSSAYRYTFTYDAAGNRRSVEAPSGDVTTYSYDLDNQLVQVEDALEFCCQARQTASRRKTRSLAVRSEKNNVRERPHQTQTPLPVNPARLRRLEFLT